MVCDRCKYAFNPPKIRFRLITRIATAELHNGSSVVWLGPMCIACGHNDIWCCLTESITNSPVTLWLP
jgi:hypothetical protein